MSSKSIKKVLILVSILAIPGFLFFYLLPQFAKNRYKNLPIFGEKMVSGTFRTVKGKKIADTIYHQIPAFKLVNQNGDTISWNTYDKKLFVVNLFNSTASSQGSNTYIKKLSDSYEKKPLIQFLSISVNPDDQDKLEVFAKSIGAKAGKWDLLAGDTTITYPLINKGMLLDALADHTTSKTNYVYSNKILLVDNFYRIRGIYESDNKEANAKLEDEIKVLIAEYLRNIKDGR